MKRQFHIVIAKRQDQPSLGDDSPRGPFSRFKEILAGIILSAIVIAALIVAVALGSVIAIVLCVVVIVVIGYLLLKYSFNRGRA